MFAKLVIALMSTLVVTALTSSQVLARGSGSAHSGGRTISSWQWHGSGGQRRYSGFWHGSRFSHQKQYPHRMVPFEHHNHEPWMSQGHWYRSPGFGSHESAWSNSNGEWHEVSGFGGGGTKGKSDFRGKRRAVSDKQYEGNCNVPGACQGVWYEVPEN